MLRPQKSISKKEIKEDKLVTSYFEVRKWMDENKRMVWYIVAAPLVIVAIVFLWSQKKTEWDASASAMMAKVTPYYDDGRYELAIDGNPQEGVQGLQAVVDEYGGTHNGQFAKLYLANSYFALKNYDKALEYYDDVNIKDRMIIAAALAGEAACYEAKGEFFKAASYYEKAASKNMDQIQGPENLQKAAVNYAAAGNKEKAVEIMRAIKKEFPASTYARNADMYIAEYSL
jgi:tetratricopeptide (TPR) repeat protein